MTIIPETCRGTCDIATQRIGLPGSGNGEPCTCRTERMTSATNPRRRRMTERIRTHIAHALYMAAMKVDPADDTLLAFNPGPYAVTRFITGSFPPSRRDP